MKYAADFRSIARESLKGKWGLAVITGFVAALLGGLGSEGLDVKLNLDMSNHDVSFAVAGQTILSTNGEVNNQLGALLAGSAVYIAIAAIILAALYFILGSVVGVGYARFNLDLIDRIEAKTETLFTYFTHWKTTSVSRLLRSLYTLLWSFLFIIPGIIAAYSYAMTDYILAEHPDMTASEAIERSKEMMSGNRFRLFCLQISFIGWSILCALTLGIGNLWLRPYLQAATAAFYREVSGTEWVERNAYEESSIDL